MTTRGELLHYLKHSNGAWISGEALAAGLGISRTAVWKQVRALQGEGYGIESSPRKGYALRKASDLLLPAEIRDGLQTTRFGRQGIAYFPQTDSTNLRARQLAAEGAPEGTLVVAETQLQGRGRRGRGWHSPAGEGIYASLILRPRIQPQEATQLVLLAAVAVAEALLASAELPFTIKWPNDILVGGKKIAGILLEMSLETERVDHVVIGLGLNVNPPAGGLPPELAGIATSLGAAAGRTFSRAELLRRCLEKLEGLYDRFLAGEREPIRRRWHELAGIVGERVRIAGIDRIYAGRVVEIDADGFLILESAAGARERILAGDLSLADGGPERFRPA